MRSTYFRSDTTGKHLIEVAHYYVIGFSVFMAGFSIGLFYVGTTMGYPYLLMGVIVSSAVVPVALTLTWRGQNAIAATAALVLGLIFSVTTCS
jgi:Na+/proline symporter